MVYAVEFSPAALRHLRKLDHPIRERILNRVERLGLQPRPRSAKKLEGSKEPLYRVREGDYRIVYTIHDNDLIVLIVRIGHRSEVYR
jgi:mRNA interferase RelE/StbE